MKFPISYDSQSMTLTIEWGKHYKCLQCPFATWWKARKYFKKPKFKFYFGPMWKYKGKVQTEFGEYDDYEYKGGYWPAASTEFLKWYTPKWFPIHVSSWDIGWKDKYNSPRYEHLGHFIIFFGRDYHKHWQFSMTVTAPDFFCNNDCTRKDIEDNYWESMLWYLYYSDEYDVVNNKPNIVKARNMMRKGHWSTSEYIELDDYKLGSSGKESLSIGCGDKKEYVFIDVKSEKLIDFINKDGNYPANRLSTDEILVTMVPEDENKKTIFERSTYCRIYERPADPENEEIVRLYYKNHDVLDFFRKGIYKEFRLEAVERIDLGPAFKDDFLTERACDIIKKQHETNNEKSE